MRNLEFAYGPELTPESRERLAREVFRQFVLFGFEVLELLLAPLARIRRKVIIVGQEHVEAALAQGRGLIAIAAHAGNWEYTIMGYGPSVWAGGGGGPGAGPPLGWAAGQVFAAAGR